MEAQNVSRTVLSTSKLSPRPGWTLSHNYHYFTRISYTVSPNAILLKCIHCIVRFRQISTKYQHCALWRCSRLISHSYAHTYCGRWYCVQTFIISIATCYLKTPVMARCKAWVCGRSLAGITDSNPARGMNVCVFRVLWDHSSRAVLPSEMCVIVIAEPHEWEAYWNCRAWGRGGGVAFFCQQQKGYRYK
jgi:hypothetical protein